MQAALPNSRQLITSLINTLTQTPGPSPPVPAADGGAASTSATTNNPINPLHQLPPSHRPLLTTLHVLFPSILLPALDLLDRRLVTRVLVDAAGPGTAVGDEQQQPEGQDSRTRRVVMPRGGVTPDFYLVRSAQQSSRRSHHNHRASATAGAGQAYVVRLEAWNCTCAAFAFSAFPSLGGFPQRGGRRSGGYEIQGDPYVPRRKGRPQQQQQQQGREGAGSDKAWEFGGLSVNGISEDGDSSGPRRNESVPCCKHLLACVLAERWSAVLGCYVEERRVGREEGAGLVDGF